MRRWLHLMLAFLIAAAVLVPPRVHAMVASPAHHAMTDCHEHEPSPAPTQDKNHALCMTACACLPVAPVILAGCILPGDGERLTPARHSLPHFPEPDLLLRPPKTLS